MEFKGTTYYIDKEGFDRVRNNDYNYGGSSSYATATNIDINFNFTFDIASGLINTLGNIILHNLENQDIHRQPSLVQGICFDD